MVKGPESSIRSESVLSMVCVGRFASAVCFISAFMWSFLYHLRMLVRSTLAQKT